MPAREGGGTAAVSHDDQWIVSCANDKRARGWGVADCKQMRTLQGHTNTFI